MKKMKKSALAAAVLLSLSMMGSAYAATTGTAVSAGQKINFGNYWQTLKSGATTGSTSQDDYNKDAITWRVLANSSGTVTLLSDKALYADAFDSSSNVWSGSQIKTTLNNATAGSGFLGDAFTGAEQGLIVEKTYFVYDDEGNKTGTDADKETGVTSKLYLLDYNDVKNGGTYGFSDNDSRKARATDFAKNVNVYDNDNVASDSGASASWLLRSPSSVDADLVWFVYYDGDFYNNYVYGDRSSVRPALDLNLSDLIYTSAATASKNSADIIGKSKALQSVGTIEKFIDMPTTFDGVVDVTLKDTSNTYTSAITASTLALDGSNVKMALSGGKMDNDGKHFASAMFNATDSSDTAYLVLKKGETLAGEQIMNVGNSLDGTKEYSLQLANEYHLGDGSIYYATTNDVKGVFSADASKNVNYTLASEATFTTITSGANNAVTVADGGTLELTESGSSVANITFKDGSTLKVDGEKVKATAAITGITSGTVESGAKLYVANAVAGQPYKILDGNGISLGSWTTDATMGDGFKATYGLVVDSENTTVMGDGLNAFVIQFKEDDGAAASGSIIPNVVEARDGELKSYVDELSNTYDGDTDKVNEQIDAMANMGENLSVSRGAYDVANMTGEAINQHWANKKDSENIWAVYTHNKEKVDGIELGGMDAKYDAQYNGVVVGVDLSKGFGVALNYADGNVSNGYGGRNDAKYYGGSIYGRKAFGNFNLFGDVTYTHGKNELEQNGVTADAKTNTISAGLTAKYLVKAGKAGNIAPFAGVRYVMIDGKDYTDSLGINREADKINSIVVPVGLEYTGEFKMAKSAWTFKPVLAVGYLFNLGDRENDMTMSYNGAKDTFGYDFVDKGAFFTRAAMNFTKLNFTLGVAYDYMKSSNSHNNKWNVNLEYAF